MNLGFLAAALVSAVTLFTHITRGSPGIVQPLLAVEGLGAASRWMMFYTWHMATIGVAMMMLGFLWAALRAEARPVALFLTVLSALWSGLCVYVTIRAQFPFEQVLPIWFFAAIALAGLAGLWLGKKVQQV